MNVPSDLKDAPNSGEFRDLSVKDAQEAEGIVPEVVAQSQESAPAYSRENDRRLNKLPAGTRLLALRDIVLPAENVSVVFHHGKILSTQEAAVITGDNDEPIYGESFCELAIKKDQGSGGQQFLLRAGESISVKRDDEGSRYAMGYALAVESHASIREFGCYAFVKEPKRFVTTALMEEHIKGILRAVAPK
ncbi:MAG: hypothetical protein NTY77_14290 [Elusimicrobia bacterium]|nr:hypothetical protein [Elusimicrobiota bacterium]